MDNPTTTGLADDDLVKKLVDLALPEGATTTLVVGQLTADTMDNEVRKTRLTNYITGFFVKGFTSNFVSAKIFKL